MPRRTFPDEGSQLVMYSKGYGLPLMSGAGVFYDVFENEAATVYADIVDLDGNDIPGSRIMVDDQSQIPQFLGPPDGKTVLWVRQVDKVRVERIVCQVDPGDLDIDQSAVEAAVEEVFAGLPAAVTALEAADLAIDVRLDLLETHQSGYHHTQGIPLADWPINHGLGRRITVVTVVDSGGTEHDHFEVEHVDENNVILHFRFAFGGTADLI